MIRAYVILLAAIWLAPTQALAGAQFSAEDIVNHFKNANAAASTPGSGTTTRPVSTARANDDAPLILPLTGAKRGVSLGAPSSGGLDLLITFETGSDRLTGQAMQNLDSFAAALRRPELADFVFEVQGHTDAAGSAAANQALSERRAKSVVTYLVQHGISSSRLEARGYGESRPLMADPKHPKNRRVETRRIR